MKWGIIGASTIAKEWMIDAMRAVGHEIVEVMSSDQARAREFAMGNDISSYGTDLDSLLQNPEITAVYISTKNHLHKEQALKAINAGKHVMCEKPLALSLEDAREMVVAAQRARVVFATNHHLRNAESHKALRRAVLGGLIGNPIAAKVSHAINLPAHLRGWRVADHENGGGVILDITVHDVDTLRFVLNDDPEEVTAFSQIGELSQNGVPDTAMGVIRFRSGLLAQFHDSFTSKHAETGIEIIGTRGTLVARDVMSQHPKGEVELRNAQGSRKLILEHVNLYEAGIRDFAEAVAGRSHPAASGVDGMWSLATGLAAVESAATGQSIRVSID